MIAFTGQEGLNASHLLGPDGLIAGQWADFEFRSEQLEMARAVQAALREGYHLVVEAGTGIGKSFAYLAGAIDRALRQKTKVVISTYTINLQEQLIGKDIPFLQAILPEQFTARLAKGRNHYLCKRRLEYAIKRQMNLFEDEGAALTRIAEWARDTPDGSLSDLPFIPPPHVWQAVQSEHGNCKGRKCPYFSKCFYGRMRRQLETADIIVANHALLFSDLVLKQSGAGVLPDYQSVILDEAHNIEHVAEDHFGIRISQFSIAYLLDHLFEPRKRKGILAFQHNAEKARSLVKTCRQAMQLFFAQVQAWFAHAGDERNGRCEAEFVQDNLSTPVKALRLCLSKLAKHTKDEDERYEILRYAERLAVLESDIKDFLFQRKEACVYWVEIERNRYRRIVLRCAPLDVGPYLKSSLFDTCQSVVLTSATLSCGPRSEGGFAFFSNRIGLETFTALQLGSPFHYEEQVTLYIETDLPDPNDSVFTYAACEAIKKYLLKSEGRAFVLFTSYALLQEASRQLEGWLAEQRMELFVQGGEMDRARMLAAFKRDTRSVLFGTDSFWQGVDVPGESLSNVIIVRLPFAVPTHPLVQGRIELLRQRGENPFFNYQLPMAILKFKQGFGRLIRSKHDTGMVVVLDSRIVRKNYGRKFIAAIPPCRIELNGQVDY
jgi:ATP-dependent DNA helicase DinG